MQREASSQGLAGWREEKLNEDGVRREDLEWPRGRGKKRNWRMTIKYGRKIHLEKIESTKSKRKESMRSIKQEEKI